MGSGELWYDCSVSKCIVGGGRDVENISGVSYNM